MRLKPVFLHEFLYDLGLSRSLTLHPWGRLRYESQTDRVIGKTFSYMITKSIFLYILYIFSVNDLRSGVVAIDKTGERPRSPRQIQPLYLCHFPYGRR